MNQRSHEAGIDLPRAWSRASSIRVEEQRPVHRTLTRNRFEPEEVGEHRKRIAPAIQPIAAPNLPVAVAIGAVSEFERDERIRFRGKPLWTTGEDLVDER